MNLLFLLKKLAGTMLMPFQLSLALIVIGTVFLWFNRCQRLAKCAVSVGVGLLVIFGNPFVGYHLVHDLEARYPSLSMERLAGNRTSTVPDLPFESMADAGNRELALDSDSLIVVLSAGASNDPGLPETDRLTSNSALRVVEAVEIYRSLATSFPTATSTNQALAMDNSDAVGEPRIILSGGPTLNTVPEAIPMEELAESLGIPAKNILLETRSDDTFSEAKNIYQMVGHKPFILVTSAIQMPRAVALFRHLDMNPIPAPANYEGQRTTEPSVMQIPPSINALDQSTAAWHERIGMLWEHLHGQL